MSLQVLERILRKPGEVAAECVTGRADRSLAAACLGAIALGVALFGAVVGSMRGGVLIAYAGLKMPLATLATLAGCVPAFHAFAAVLGRPWSYRTTLSLTLAAGARASLSLVASAPALWPTINLGAGYHALKLLATLAYALAGLAACVLLVGLRPRPERSDGGAARRGWRSILSTQLRRGTKRPAREAGNEVRLS